MGHQHCNLFNFVLFMLHFHVPHIIPIDTVHICNGMSFPENKLVNVYCWSIVLCTSINVDFFQFIAAPFSRTFNHLCLKEREAECLRTSPFVHILTQFSVLNIQEYVEGQNSLVNTAISYS